MYAHCVCYRKKTLDQKWLETFETYNESIPSPISKQMNPTPDDNVHFTMIYTDPQDQHFDKINDGSNISFCAFNCCVLKF